jgi:hypothetical protein
MKKTIFKAILIFAITGLSVGSIAAYHSSFSDVAEQDWFYDSVMRMIDLDVMEGYGDGTFKPANTVNRAEIATMLDRYDQGKIEEIIKELEIIRSKSMDQMMYSEFRDWAQFKANADQFPARKHILPRHSYLGVDWSSFDTSNLNDFEVVAVDNSWYPSLGLVCEILVPKSLIPSNPHQIFFAHRRGATTSEVYGPFWGTLDAIVTDINANYYDPNLPTTP